MIRGTAMAIALAKAADNAPKNGLGIEHCIRHRVDETNRGVIQEPDVFLHTNRYTGPYKGTATPKTVIDAQVEAQHNPVSQPEQK